MIVIVGFLVLIWLLVSYLGAQQAVRWWHHRQTMQLHHEAEQIRDGLLQEVFTLRRQLELSLIGPDQSSTAVSQHWLTVIEQFHTSLKTLSDQLSPPFLGESLPLAIQASLESWRSRYPLVQLDVMLPVDWQQEPYEHSRAILMALNELLRIYVSDPLTEASVSVNLNLRGHLSQLKVHITYAAELPNRQPCLQESDCLRRSFQFLTGGSCFYRCRTGAIVWYFRWRPSLQAALKLTHY